MGRRAERRGAMKAEDVDDVVGAVEVNDDMAFWARSVATPELGTKALMMRFMSLMTMKIDDGKINEPLPSERDIV